MPAKPCPKVQYLHFFWTPPRMLTPPPPWAACSDSWPLFQKEIFPNIQAEPPLTQLEDIASRPFDTSSKALNPTYILELSLWVDCFILSPQKMDGGWDALSIIAFLWTETQSSAQASLWRSNPYFHLPAEYYDQQQEIRLR